MAVCTKEQCQRGGIHRLSLRVQGALSEEGKRPPEVLLEEETLSSVRVGILAEKWKMQARIK